MESDMDQPFRGRGAGGPRAGLGGGWCEGDANEFTTHGDPFFRLNPENGAIMARDLAKGLSKLRPDQQAAFEGNAEAFAKTLALDIERWKEALKPLAGMRILCTQCGWQTFAGLGGPELLVCKRKPGCCPTPEALVKHVEEMKVSAILLDPHTMPNHVKALRTVPDVLIVASPPPSETCRERRVTGPFSKNFCPSSAEVRQGARRQELKGGELHATQR